MSSLAPAYLGRHVALEHFRRAQRRALCELMRGRLSRRPANLICVDDLPWPTVPGRPGGLQDIPLGAVIGSVGRCRDFTSDFLPLRGNREERWVGALQRLYEDEGWPPIEAFQLDDVYFVKDGHHRVSVARYLGFSTVEAFVTELKPLGVFSSES